MMALSICWTERCVTAAIVSADADGHRGVAARVSLRTLADRAHDATGLDGSPSPDAWWISTIRTPTVIREFEGGLVNPQLCTGAGVGRVDSVELGPARADNRPEASLVGVVLLLGEGLRKVHVNGMHLPV